MDEADPTLAHTCVYDDRSCVIVVKGDDGTDEGEDDAGDRPGCTMP